MPLDLSNFAKTQDDNSELPVSVVNSGPQFTLASGSGNNALLVRTPPNRVAGSLVGYWAGGYGPFNVTDDPSVSLGYQGGAGDYVSTLQLEGDWDTSCNFTATISGGTSLTNIVKTAPANTLINNGATITGPGIPGGTTISNYNSGAGTATLSQACTNGVGVALTASGSHITETYWQIIKADGVTSRRPMYGQYDRTMGRMVKWIFLAGNGLSETGAQASNPGGIGPNNVYQFNWDDDSSPAGIGGFAWGPNRFSIYGISDGGITADENRIRVYSNTGKGSALSLTYNGNDAEGTANPTFVLGTASALTTYMYSRGVHLGDWTTGTLTQSPLSLNGGIGLGDFSGNYRGSIWYSNGVPSNTMGNNGDVCFNSAGGAGTTLYQKRAGAWVATAA